MKPVRGQVLGTAIDVVDYASAVERVRAWATAESPRLVAAANTHLVAAAHEDAAFAKVLADFDLVAPDGMPLVWALRLEGFALNDRVYGPYLMEHSLRALGPPCRHLFVGGTRECLDALGAAAQRLNPAIELAGAVSPPFGVWDDSVDASLVEQIRASGANVIWLALGGVRQETWLARHRHRLPPGVYLAVGDAFALIAGHRSYAPRWMQRAGLTWLHRLASEPRRLGQRYASYNSRFAWAYLRDRWRLAHGPAPLDSSSA